MRYHRALVGLALCAAVGRPARAAAQDATTPLPAVAEFHVTAGLASLSWARDAVAAAAGPTLSVERHVLGPTAVQLGATTVSAAVGTEPARHYLVDAGVLVAPTLSLGTWHVTPQLGIGIGTTVTDPGVDSLPTRSQNTWGWTVGADAQLFGSVTVGARYRHFRVRLQDPASTAPTVAGTPTGVTWLEARLGVRF
jgi:hypothetical protein